MKRRDSLKTLVLGSLGATMTFNSCITDEDKLILDQVWNINMEELLRSWNGIIKCLRESFLMTMNLKL